ncbi:MAG: acetylxylan esterase [Candidatus Latescibacter sp.]|nr:acetylxylan esterase [Candidatus Latescibacter sp.]
MQKRFSMMFCFIMVYACLLPLFANAQPVQQTVRVIIVPDRPSWEYTCEEKPIFTISVIQFGNPMDGVAVRYTIGPEKMAAVKSGTAALKNGCAKVGEVTMSVPGFLQCSASVTVEGREYSGIGAAGFEPLKIRPSSEPPADFADFWEKGKADLARIPMDARVTLLPEKCTSTLNVYHVNLQSWGMSRLYGILCVPKKAGKYPALLRVPGAGVRPYNGDTAMADKGMITLEIGIHGIPVTMEPGVYADLSKGALGSYWTYNLDNRDTYYFRRVYLGCIRALDFITSLPEYDGERLAVTGSSQGGALTVATSALDPRVKWMGVYCPALCDVTGYLNGRAGGWPHMFATPNSRTRDRVDSAKYYDVTCFARLLKIPGIYSWGFVDATCPPTSMFAAYNAITAPKELYLVLDSGHWNYPEQSERINNWLTLKMTGK